MAGEVFNWLHLSDLHWGQTGQKHLWPRIRQALLRDLESLHNRCGPWHAVLFTGDLVMKGQGFSGMQETVLCPLWDRLKQLGSAPVLLAVPGNHDLDRSKVSPPVGASQSFPEPAEYHRKADEFWQDGHSEFRKMVTSTFSNYADWWATRPFSSGQAMTDGLLPGDFSTTFELGKQRVGVVGLNTTFAQLTSGDYRQRLFCDVRQLHGVCCGDGATWLQERHGALLLTHHPPQWLDEHSYQEMYGREINPVGSFVAHLFGHMHLEAIRGESRGGGRQRLYWQGSPLFGSDPHGAAGKGDGRHGYSAGRLVFGEEGTQLLHWPRRATWDDVNGWRFVSDNEGCMLDAMDSVKFIIVPGSSVCGESCGPRPPDEAFDWRPLQAYLDHLGWIANRLLVGHWPDAYAPQDVGAVTLDRVYIDMDTKCRLHDSRPDEPGLDQKPVAGQDAAQERLLSIMEAASRFDRLVVTGEPGSGKSSFVNRLTCLMANACCGREELPRGWSHGPLLPVQVDLDHLVLNLPAPERLAGLTPAKRADALLRSVREAINMTVTQQEAGGQGELFVSALESRKCLVIFDELDRVTPDRRAFAREAIESLAHRYAGNRFVVTSRESSYYGNARLSGAFVQVQLARLRDPQITSFIDAWCGALAQAGCLTETESRKRAGDLRSTVAGLDELPTNPLLLTCIVLASEGPAETPSTRAQLYKRCLETLVRRWCSPATGGGDLLEELELEDSDVLRVLREVAHQAHLDDMHGEASGLSQARLLEIVASCVGGVAKAERLLQHINERGGLFVGGRKSPEYRPLQEFLVAWHLAVTEVALDRRLHELLTGAEHWALVARLAAEHLLYNETGYLTRVLDAIYNLCPCADVDDEEAWRGVVWAGAMLVEVGCENVEADRNKPDGGTALISRMRPRLVALAERPELLSPLERADAGVFLGELEDPRDGVGGDGVPDIAWCEVPPGPFVMGSDRETDPAARGCELPQHLENSIRRPYFIGKYPVTNKQFGYFVSRGGYHDERHWLHAIRAGRWHRGKVRRTYWDHESQSYIEEPADAPHGYLTRVDLPNHPVVGVSWYEMIAFCSWLTAELKGGAVGGGRATDASLESAIATGEFIVRLPTEAEWEKAARGTDGQVYPWGDAFETGKCNSSESGLRELPTAVGIFPGGRSPYGCLDMAGNVCEWCLTEWAHTYEGYDAGRQERESLAGETARVHRGGAFGRTAREVRCAHRDSALPHYALRRTGFRVVLARE